MPMHDTLIDYLDHWAQECPDRIWLRETLGENHRDWSWAEAQRQVRAIAAWQEAHLGSHGRKVGIVSRNRPHWFFADLGTIAAGNVVVPMFTTLARATAEYVMQFTGMEVLFVGETENWNTLKEVLPSSLQLVALPGVELDREHLCWDDIVSAHEMGQPAYRCAGHDLVSLVFTSGTTGVPKGVMQTHQSNILPIDRFRGAFGLDEGSRYFSYLPLSHIAERQIVEGSSLMTCGEVRFNENLGTLFRDLPAARPHVMFGPPRVWEQLQQAIIGKFGSRQAVDEALAADRDGVGKLVRQSLGLDEAIYLLTAAAPTPPALIEWYEQFGLMLMEGFGQTEAMGLTANERGARKIGSIGRPVGPVEVRISPEGELQIRADGCSPGYYNMPEKTAETFVDGWIHTGDKAYIDEDGFIFLTGRVKDYFKTIQGKFVAPTPIENLFAENPYTEQCCLLGRGYSKTVMTCVLSALAQQQDPDEVARALAEKVEAINKSIEKHARIGALMMSNEAWTIENEMLTPTLKIRREEVEKKFGDRARELATLGAQSRELQVEWA